MKVLYIDQSGQLGGGEIALIPWLLHAHRDAKVVLFEDGPYRILLEQHGIPVDVLALGALKSVRRESGLGSVLGIMPAFASLRGRLTRLASEFDLLYANSQKAFLVAAVSKRRGQPLIWHLRDILTADHFSWLMRKIVVALGNWFATVIIVNSYATGESFIAAGGRRDKVRIIHDGVNPEPFDLVSADDVANLRRTVGDDSDLLIGSFSRLSDWKGQHILLDAVSRLPNAHAVVVGEALFGEEIYAQSLRARAKKTDLAGRVHFLGFRSDIPALMKSMDIIVHTSIAAEPFGLVIVEGMLAGRPVIATRDGGALEIVEDGRSGILVTPGSVDELHRAIEGLIMNRIHREEIAEAGRNRATELFSVERLIEKISAILREVEERLTHARDIS